MAGDYGNGGDLVPDNEGKEEGGYCIKIYVGADNQVKGVAVKREHEMPMGGEEGGQAGAAGAPEQEAEMEMMTKVPVDSIEGALALVQQAYESQGQLPTGGEGMERGDAMADMMQGYGKGGLRGQSEGMGIKKVFR